MAAPARSPTGCWPTGAMTTTSTAGCCERSGSHLSSPAAARHTGPGLGRHRWVVERGFAHLTTSAVYRTRYERDPEIHRLPNTRLLHPLPAKATLILKDLLSGHHSNPPTPLESLLEPARADDN